MPVACVGQAVRAKTGRSCSAVVRTDVPAAARVYLSPALLGPKSRPPEKYLLKHRGMLLKDIILLTVRLGVLTN